MQIGDLAGIDIILGKGVTRIECRSTLPQCASSCTWYLGQGKDHIGRILLRISCPELGIFYGHRRSLIGISTRIQVQRWGIIHRIDDKGIRHFATTGVAVYCPHTRLEANGDIAIEISIRCIGEAIGTIPVNRDERRACCQRRASSILQGSTRECLQLEVGDRRTIQNIATDTDGGGRILLDRSREGNGWLVRRIIDGDRESTGGIVVTTIIGTASVSQRHGHRCTAVLVCRWSKRKGTTRIHCGYCVKE